MSSAVRSASAEYKNFELKEDDSRYQRLRTAMQSFGAIPQSSKYLNENQRKAGRVVLAAELAEMGRSGLINMGQRSANMKNYLMTKFHADDAHFLVYGTLRVEEGDVRHNLGMRALVVCDRVVIRAADGVSSLMRAVWKRTAQAAYAFFYPPQQLEDRLKAAEQEPTTKPVEAFANSPPPQHLLEPLSPLPALTGKAVSVSVRVDTDENETSLVGSTTPIAAEFSPAHADNRTPTADKRDDDRSRAQSPRPAPRRPHRPSASMCDMGHRADGRSRAVVTQETALSAKMLACCARVQKSCCCRFPRALWNFVPEGVRNHIVKDFIKDPLKEGVRDATRVAVIYAVYTLFRMVIG